MVPGMGTAIQGWGWVVSVLVRFLPFFGALGIDAMTDSAVLLEQRVAVVDDILVEPAFGGRDVKTGET